MEYYERDINESFTGRPLVVKAGEMVFTPPLKVHLVRFTQDTTLLSLAKNVRSPELHAEDMVKERFYKWAAYYAMVQPA